MRYPSLATFIALALVFGCKSDNRFPRLQQPPLPAGAPAARETLAQRADRLARETIIVDGHIDLPHRLHKALERDPKADIDISTQTSDGDFDYIRAREGGLDAPFMSIYVPASYQKSGGAKEFADQQIARVENIVKRWPQKFALAVSPDEIMRNFAANEISLPMGMENGAPIENDLNRLKYFYDRGIRYITLTHSKDNAICDSSYDKARTWKGLSPFGRQVVREMNRLGIMVDISHVSDDTFYQVLDETRVPVIASHSSARKFTPEFERNMSDDMIKKLAANGGVIMINFGSTFISQESRASFDGYYQALDEFEAALPKNMSPKDKHRAELAFQKDWRRKRKVVLASLKDVVAHIEHVKSLAGVEHIGFGSDFDGVGDTLPTGLKHAGHYPALIKALLDKGYTDDDIRKISSGNIFRVWRRVEAYARSQRAPSKTTSTETSP